VTPVPIFFHGDKPGLSIVDGSLRLYALAAAGRQEIEVLETITSAVERNQPCPCGSGLKAKRCLPMV
jgi:uncharacterized protein YecA (UPF0149 family)